MLCILSEYRDPYFNLASEEYLLKCFKEDVFLVYRNEPSIIVGKHQNTLAEINLPFVLEKGIRVARRISGGGTVFHDLGNLNFAFLTTGEEGAMVNYRQYTLPVIEAMKGMGLEVVLGDRNELLLGNQKISGTASHVFKKRVLHHGTLLFSSEMRVLSDALRIKPGRFQDRAVKSVKSGVTNIRDHLDQKMEITDFQNQIVNFIMNSGDDHSRYNYTKKDLKEIEKLRVSKFATWEWNFGYSPAYQFTKRIQVESGYIDIQLNVNKGIITEIHLQGGFKSTGDIKVLEDVLTGILHDPESIRKRLSGIGVEDYIPGLNYKGLLSAMF